MRIEIKVTKRDIAKGERADADSCPIARAARRTLKRRVRVSEDRLWLRVKTGEVLLSNLPATAGRFADSFDKGRPVEPLTFWVSIRKDTLTWR